MTTTTRNEAAERLLELLMTMENAAGETVAGHVLDEALAAERRATVERIRERLGTLAEMQNPANPGRWMYFTEGVHRVLDEEAAR